MTSAESSTADARTDEGANVTHALNVPMHRASLLERRAVLPTS